MVIAAPLDEAPGPAARGRDEATVFMCEDTHFRGNCLTDVIQIRSCYNTPRSFVDRISSIRNEDKKRDTCTWYRDSDCRGETYHNQEDANLADGNGHFNDAIRSYECKRK
ncbi:hypothetical protein CORC01_04600 [Colletotrichum orchidophilum]|uniref:Beta/gamma crystallin 'Greek key' domain-containing protein n=1 Tax=Colletotrichum orchidophilum TaxID=1209926 RepID=A0A1G4BFH6_9PEZI|nr:uncharacterized protein CORC01_04600 [Colletotrichum orchidophilum]OHF00192.1 hypothetical protein CORC01_04600 [Colletotrichum orchidophilum]